MSNREVAEKLVKQLDGARVKLVEVEDRPGHDYRYSLDSQKARRSLGWSPTRSFDEGLGITVKWYREHVSWWKPLATQKVLSDAPWKERW